MWLTILAYLSNLDCLTEDLFLDIEEEYEEDLDEIFEEYDCDFDLLI